jgi:type I restriction enzyme S subunit
MTANIALKQLMPSKTGSVDPFKFPDETFDLYSIPAYDVGEPEVVRGRQIGSAKQTVQPGDVLLSRIVPHIRRAWVVGKNQGRRTIASGEWIIFRSNKFHPSYLRHLLIGEPFYARFLQTVAGVGGSLLRARPAQVADIEILIPPIPEQQRIALQLEHADRLRRTRRYALQMCDELLPAAFLEMFGDRFNKRLIRRFGNLVKITGGGTPSRDHLEYFEGKIPWFTAKDMHGEYIWDTQEH